MSTPRPEQPGRPYGPPGEGAALRPGTAKNNLGVIAIVAGAVGLIGVVLPGVGGYLTLIAAIVAIISAVLSIRASARGQATNRPLAITGLVLGVVELILFGVALLGLALWASATA